MQLELAGCALLEQQISPLIEVVDRAGEGGGGGRNGRAKESSIERERNAILERHS